MLRIALDAMGGDHGPSVVVPAALRVLSTQTDLHLILIGDEERLRRRLGKKEDVHISIRHASQQVEMDEMPSRALRSKKDSSMRVAINLVKSGEADACVSAGNTGALMATARHVLKTLPGIDRPAIITALPTSKGHTHMLDLGANVNCTAEHLFQFAVMGAELTSAVDNLSAPRVGLLNVGEEEIKGNEQVRKTARLLANSHINYIGFVEGDDIYKGVADVIVTDGFVGNIALKASEGAVKMIGFYTRQGFNRNLFTRFAGLISLPVIKRLRKKLDPRRYNGASLLGLQGIVVKSHGSADVLAFSHAIKEAVLEVRKNVPQRIHSELEAILSERQAA
ncbi:MAG: phosphate acyltransferase PlsX [Gammaproteobacteria bacterium]|nr:phosphate acyltransferase PlsX [Gammaproteobacteria bacterium]